MKKTITLKLSDENDLLVNAKVTGTVLKVHQGRSNGKFVIFVRLENEIVGYEFMKREENFAFQWKKSLKTNAVTDQLLSYPMWTYDVSNNGNDELITRESDGLKLYKVFDGDEGSAVLGSSTMFHDAYGSVQELSIGRFFTDSRYVGVMRRSKMKLNYFYVIKADCVEPNCGMLRPLKAQPTLSGAWKDPETRFILTNLQKKSAQETFILRTLGGLEFYRFNVKNIIEKMFTENNNLGPSTGDERFLFGSFTNQDFQDILHLNSSGLFFYHFDAFLTGYAFLHYAPEFSYASGWTKADSESLFVGDFDGDEKADIIFTGVDGLAIKTFDSGMKSWQSLMEPERRFGRTVGVASVDGEQIIFLQTADGALKHSKISTQLAAGGKVKLKVTKVQEQMMKEGNQEDSISIYNI